MLPRRTRMDSTTGDPPVQESEEGSPRSLPLRMPAARPATDTLEPEVPELQGDDKIELPKYGRT